MGGNLNIEFNNGIHAEIKGRDTVMANTPLILDPITKSYSENGEIIMYRLSIVGMEGITNPVLLNNGKNSRFTASGSGTCTVELYIEDEEGNYDTDSLIINIG
jgi:hypothetical protein